MVLSTPGVEMGCVRSSYTRCGILLETGEAGLNLTGASPTFSAERTIATGNDFLQLRLENSVKARRFRPVRAGVRDRKPVRRRPDVLEDEYLVRPLKAAADPNRWCLVMRDFCPCPRPNLAAGHSQKR